MKSKTSFVRTDGTIHLDSKPSVDMNTTLIVLPRYSKHDDSFGFNDPLKNACVAIIGAPFQYRTERGEYLLNSLMKLGLCRIPLKNTS
jgi:hypothetical protein